MHWIIQTLIATVGFAAIILLLTHLTYLGMSATVISFYFFLFSAIGFAVFGLLVQKTPLELPRSNLLKFIALGCISVFANYFALGANSSAPNPGLVRAVQSMEAVFVTIAAIFLYKARIDPRQAIGILLNLIGLFLVSYRG